MITPSPSILSVDIVIPVLNEAHVLEQSVETVLRYGARELDCGYRVVVVDNGSTDGTQDVARRLSDLHSAVDFLHLEQKGRGRALRHAWLQSRADIVCYTDVDLSTDLRHLPELIDAIAEEGYDIAIGSRLMSRSIVKRSVKRELISQAYNVILRYALSVGFSDAQCGFKALSRAAVEAIVPHVEDQSWFFDTELLVLAERAGLRIKDVPVIWREDDDSRVKIFQTALDDLKGVWRLRRAARERSLAAVAAKPRGK